MPALAPLAPRRRSVATAVAFAILGVVMSVVVLPTAAHADLATGDSIVQAGSDLELREVKIERRLMEARAEVVDARTRQSQLAGHLAELTEQAEQAALRAASLRRRMEAQPAGGVFDAITSFVVGSETTADQAVAAVDDEQHALELVRIATEGVEAADERLAEARHELLEAGAAAARLERRTTAQVAARKAAAMAGFGAGYDVADPVQDKLNRRALARWQHYLIDLGNTGIVPPKAEVLEDPDALRAPFEPVRDGRGRAVPGVAEVETKTGETLLVLPKETVRAVSRAFGMVGVAQGLTADTAAFSCGGLVARAWATGTVPVDAVAQWQDLRSVQPQQAQVGDLVFVTGAADEPDRSGIALGDDLVITAAPDTGVAAVQRAAGAQVLGARSASLPQSAKTTTTQSTTTQPTVSCIDPAAAVAAPYPGSTWTWPVGAGSYLLSVGFGAAGPLWSSGTHTGQDFAAPVGTAVHAARAGVVTVEHPSWAGNLVRVDHGDGVETLYAHLSEVTVSPGDRVDAGALIGAVGSEGNSTGPHLHFEVRIDGVSLDPIPVLEGRPAQPATKDEGTNG